MRLSFLIVLIGLAALTIRAYADPDCSSAESDLEIVMCGGQVEA